MSDIRIYTAAQAGGLTPLTGDIILCSEAFNGAPANSVHLALAGGATPTWKSFANDAEAASYVYANQYALDLDGTDDYIDCGGASDFGFTDGAGNDSAFTLSAWVKFDSPTAQRILDKSGSTQASRSYLFGTDGAKRFSIFLGPYNSAAGDYLYVTETTILYSGVWYHLVSTYDGSKTAGGISLYRNGSPSTTTDSSAGNYAGMPSTSETLKIGKFNLNGSVMNGLIDEVAIFDYELTASEVASLSSADNTQPVDISTLSIAQPIAWYRMGDDIDRTGTSIKNAANPGTNNGTIVNGTSANTTPNFVDLSATSESVYVA